MIQPFCKQTKIKHTRTPTHSCGAVFTSLPLSLILVFIGSFCAPRSTRLQNNVERVTMLCAQHTHKHQLQSGGYLLCRTASCRQRSVLQEHFNDTEVTAGTNFSFMVLMLCQSPEINKEKKNGKGNYNNN